MGCGVVSAVRFKLDPPGVYCGVPIGQFVDTPFGSPSVRLLNAHTSLNRPWRIAPPTIPKPWHAPASRGGVGKHSATRLKHATWKLIPKHANNTRILVKHACYHAKNKFAGRIKPFSVSIA